MVASRNEIAMRSAEPGTYPAAWPASVTQQPLPASLHRNGASIEPESVSRTYQNRKASLPPHILVHLPI